MVDDPVYCRRGLVRPRRNRAAIRPAQPFEALSSHGPPGTVGATVGANDAEHTPDLDLEGHAVDGRHATVHLPQGRHLRREGIGRLHARLGTRFAIQMTLQYSFL